MSGSSEVMDDPGTRSLLDQLRAAEAEVGARTRSGEVAAWLQPEGLAASVTVSAGAAYSGPVAGLFREWVQSGLHPPGCPAARRPRPLFALVTDPHVFCARCFGWVLHGFLDAKGGSCSVCCLDSDRLHPTTATHGMVTVYALVCPGCALRERQRAARERHLRVTGRANDGVVRGEASDDGPSGLDHDYD